MFILRKIEKLPIQNTMLIFPIKKLHAREMIESNLVIKMSFTEKNSITKSKNQEISIHS